MEQVEEGVAEINSQLCSAMFSIVLSEAGTILTPPYTDQNYHCFTITGFGGFIQEIEPGWLRYRACEPWTGLLWLTCQTSSNFGSDQ
jgi:hypothetical protein